MTVLMLGLVARLSLTLPAYYPLSVAVMKGPVKCGASSDAIVTVSGRVVLVGTSLTGKEGIRVDVMRAGQHSTGAVVTSDVVTSLRIGKDGKYGPFDGMSGVLLTGSAPGFYPASVMVNCSSTVDFVLAPIPSTGG